MAWNLDFSSSKVTEGLILMVSLVPSPANRVSTEISMMPSSSPSDKEEEDVRLAAAGPGVMSPPPPLHCRLLLWRQSKSNDPVDPPLSWPMATILSPVTNWKAPERKSALVERSMMSLERLLTSTGWTESWELRTQHRFVLNCCNNNRSRYNLPRYLSLLRSNMYN